MNWNMWNFQDPSSLTMIKLSALHDYFMMFIMLIMFIIMYMMFFIITSPFTNRFLLNNNIMEITWTISPMILLVYLALPSIKLLYMMEEDINPIFTIKAIGHQWYWSYEYPEFFSLTFDSFMDSTSNLFRLMDVDNRMVMPFFIPLRIITTSLDVIHSWTVPSMGIKMDSVPGRLNQMMLIPTSLGVFFGQCSEICGLNHSFMPISVEVTDSYFFTIFMNNSY